MPKASDNVIVFVVDLYDLITAMTENSNVIQQSADSKQVYRGLYLMPSFYGYLFTRSSAVAERPHDAS